ncbi:LPXTG-anchored surface protein SasK [Staphylococcus aureus]|uniref:LPXTG-anchored surface protein SasK n=1 Tax=Staphylococcus aureus TaxID=1280 RepID=UPI000911FB05|nr:LPXTG-anchored surface protein SasK [Staphylococcus aureus]WQK93129.1 LPXTG-anchored surface protein SasK [Staphylococcus aureus]SGU33762.1 cell wall anchored protein, putative [Staphylococcus aureus]SGU46060.1 cell wall anchored protein, putative [Staphylococcus aureus]SGZ18991.1 cell wall anchored protein, putative [Staphylococcus aureus]SGZ19642.1 cell wall anchored protein, putative [Staphylococcus aureus]
MKKVISLFVAILSVLIFTDNANAENNKPEGVNENSNLIPVRQPDANYPGPVSDIARVKKLDNLIDGTKDPDVIKQLKDDNEVPNNAVKAKDSKIVSDCRHLLKHPDNLMDGTKDPKVIKQLKNANVTSNNGAVNPSVKANDTHTKSNKQMAKQQSNYWDSKGKSIHKQQLKELPKTGVNNESNTAIMALFIGLILLVVSLVTRFIKLNSHQ